MCPRWDSGWSLATLGPTFNLYGQGRVDQTLSLFPDFETCRGGKGQLTREARPTDYTVKRSCV